MLKNDTDADKAVRGETLTATQVAGAGKGPEHGTVVLNADGSFTYTPAAGYSGPDFFTYVVSDGFVTSNEATVNLTVDAPPVAVNDNYTVNMNSVLTISDLDGVLQNDIDADKAILGQTLTAALVTSPITPQHGTLTLNPDGSFTYTPTPGFTGLDKFIYTVSDGLLVSNRGNVYIKVNAPG